MKTAPLIVGLLIAGLLTLILVAVLIELADMPLCTVTRTDLNGNKFEFRVPCEWQKPAPEPVLPSHWKHI